MIKKLLAVFLFWFCGFGNAAFAQKENYVWYFGDSAGVDFNSGNPVALTNGMLSTNEGCATLSDSMGNLLFYTDGIKVWDKNHNQMPNGYGLAGGWSATQSALIIPFPGNNMLFYIFTVEEYVTLLKHFSYSIVDLSLNGGNGDVTIKNSVLFSGSTEKLAAVKHANNTDTWIMIHQDASTVFYSYLVTTSGVVNGPMSYTPLYISNADAIGQMKFSPDGSKIALATAAHPNVALFDFDASTGNVSNYINLTTPLFENTYGLEFSESGNYLYCSISNSFIIYQWDISSNDSATINTSIQTVAYGNGLFKHGGMQMGPDGKIYVTQYLVDYLAVINNPELPGILCNYVDSAVSLSGRRCYVSLPDFNQSSFLPTGIPTNNPQQNQLTISPNPATDKITISFPATTNESITIKIYAVTGEVVFEEENKSTAPITDYQIPVTNFTNGIYFLSVQTDGEVMTKKIVVNH